ncbi:hypothetical protein B0H14DRAFT_2843233 [Mycena olivaceomarginata]|nr:hypothetical protein B0H14DRAFT_2843233 [Mycena olivaceomarginata]
MNTTLVPNFLLSPIHICSSFLNFLSCVFAKHTLPPGYLLVKCNHFAEPFTPAPAPGADRRTNAADASTRTAVDSASDSRQCPRRCHCSGPTTPSAPRRSVRSWSTRTTRGDAKSQQTPKDERSTGLTSLPQSYCQSRGGQRRVRFRRTLNSNYG